MLINLIHEIDNLRYLATPLVTLLSTSLATLLSSCFAHCLSAMCSVRLFICPALCLSSHCCLSCCCSHCLGSRAMCGEVEAVQAMSSSAIRKYEVEDTVVINLRFDSGATAAILAFNSAMPAYLNCLSGNGYRTVCVLRLHAVLQALRLSQILKCFMFML